MKEPVTKRIDKLTIFGRCQTCNDITEVQPKYLDVDNSFIGFTCKQCGKLIDIYARDMERVNANEKEKV